MDETIGAPKKRKGQAIDRATALRRSSLIFLGGFATSGLAASPALATHVVTHLDNPPLGMAIAGGGGFVRARVEAKSGVERPKLPRHLHQYRPAAYVAMIMKRYDDTLNKKHAGVPNDDDLDALNIPIPPGLCRLAAYRIPSTDAPHIAGLDETAVTTTPNGGDGYHGHHPYQENTPDAGTPVWGTTKPALYYDIFVLVYG